MNRDIFVIMPSNLENYPHGAKDRKNKFIRAVMSFLFNDYEEKRLIIVADGCQKTKEIYEARFADNKNITFIYGDKQEAFSGNVRQAGILYATTMGKPCDITCYLDSDDTIGEKHLSNIVKYFGDSQFVYFNDHLYYAENKVELRQVELSFGMCGTSSIAHLNKPEYGWSGCDKYGHDWLFIQNLMALTDNYKKIRGCSYYVMHICGILDN